MPDHDDPFASIQADIKAKHDADVPDVGTDPAEDILDSVFRTLEKAYGPPPPITGATIRANCRFCHGKGCLNCDTLADQEYKRQFPNGPQPLVTLNRDDPEDMGLLGLLLTGCGPGQTQAEMAAQAETDDQPHVPTCRRCTGCEGMTHHWIEDCDEADPPTYTHHCKHCESVGMMCDECDTEGCEACDQEGVHYVGTHGCDEDDC